MTPEKFSKWIETVISAASHEYKRRLIVLEGDIDWVVSLLSTIPSFSASADSLEKTSPKSLTKVWHIYSDSKKLEGNVNRQTYQHKLGTESQFVVFNDQQFNIDACAALSGTLVAGGIFFIIFPPKCKLLTSVSQSPFLQRLISKISKNKHCYIVEQSHSFLPTLASIKKEEINQVKLIFSKGCATQEQFDAVKHIIQVVKGHRNRPLVLTADRGRGKSSALAIACAELLNNTQTKLRVIITAPHQQSLNIFFKQIAKSLPSAEIKANQIIHVNGVIEFLPVDQIIKNKISASLVIVDEAAGVPVYLLNALVEKYHRMVFSSTVHGYEGAGRSFTLKFQKYLELSCPQWQSYHISQPIRWAENDPLEAFMFDACLLDAQLPALSSECQKIKLTNLVFNEITAKELIENESLLSKIFSVLVTAHYQTSPSDVKLLLDNKSVSLATLTYQEQIVAVVLLINEGEVQQVDIDIIKNSKGRLKDQFIPQSLLTHCGIEQSFDYRYLRIMRIAVHPELQGQKVGCFLLDMIEKYARDKEFDFVGSSFGCNSQLLNFWQKSHYKIARIGFKKDKSSGEHSALVLKALNAKSDVLLNNVEKQFYRAFDYLLVEQYNQLPTKLIWQILQACPKSYLPLLSEDDLKSVADFQEMHRQYSSCVYGLHQWLLHQMKMPFNEQMSPVINRILQKIECSEIYRCYGFKGNKDFNAFLVEYVKNNNKLINQAAR